MGRRRFSIRRRGSTKIGVKPEWRVSAHRRRRRGVSEGAARTRSAELSIGRVVKDSDAIFFGVTKESELQRLGEAEDDRSSRTARCG